MVLPRLLYGFLSQSTDPINLTIPWQTSDQDGLFQMNYSLEKAVETNLRSWAKTNRGERPMRFEFGLDARRMVFEPEPIAKEFLLNRARQQLTRYFGFLQINELDVIISSEDEGLSENNIRIVIRAQFKDDENKKIFVSEEVGV